MRNASDYPRSKLRAVLALSPYATRLRRSSGQQWRICCRDALGCTRMHRVDYSPRHRRDGRAGTTILYQARIYRRTHSLSVMTTGGQLLGHGHRRRYRLGRRTRDLPGTRSSRRTEPEYTAARGRHDHATFQERTDASVRCTGLGARLQD